MKTKNQHRLKGKNKMKPIEKFILAMLIGAIASMSLFLLTQFLK